MWFHLWDLCWVVWTWDLCGTAVWFHLWDRATQSLARGFSPLCGTRLFCFSQTLPHKIFLSLQFYHNLNILEIKFNCLVSREVWLENHFCKTLSAFLNLPTCNKIVSGYSLFSGQQFGHIINRPMYIVDILQPQLLCTEGSIFRNVSGASIMTLFCNL